MGTPQRAKGNNREATPTYFGARQEEGRNTRKERGSRAIWFPEGEKRDLGGKSRTTRSSNQTLKEIIITGIRNRTGNRLRTQTDELPIPGGMFGRSFSSAEAVILRPGKESCLIRESSSSSNPKTPPQQQQQQPIFIAIQLPPRGGNCFSRPGPPISPLQIPARCLASPRLALPSTNPPHYSRELNEPNPPPPSCYVWRILHPARFFHPLTPLVTRGKGEACRRWL